MIGESSNYVLILIFPLRIRFFDKFQFPLAIFIFQPLFSFDSDLRITNLFVIDKFLYTFKEFVLYSLRGNKGFLQFLKDSKLTPYENELQILFQKYLAKGGFPHLLEIEKPSQWLKLLRQDIIEKRNSGFTKKFFLPSCTLRVIFYFVFCSTYLYISKYLAHIALEENS